LDVPYPSVKTKTRSSSSACAEVLRARLKPFL
jgi:hypothetical protein